LSLSVPSFIIINRHNMSTTPPLLTSQSDILPFADVDSIRFERNLLQIGFFAADEKRKGTPATKRRIETTINRDGKRIVAAIEFEGTRGLPSTADRDKFMAFLKIADEQRARHGYISNPIRFTAYRLLKELGIATAGSNYEDIKDWGERMAVTTITSRQVIFFARTKRYADKVIHVFDAFQRVGKQSGTGRSDEYEVTLASWLLDNLNATYVYVEDFAPYKKLRRPIAKAIFGLLHWWFQSSNGHAVEKDYQQLCILLGIQSYRQPSRIKLSIGRALDELISVRYLSRWDVQLMSSKIGYKVMLWPGEDILRSLSLATPRLPSTTQEVQALTSTSTPTADASEADSDTSLTMEAQQALDELLTFGIARSKAEQLVKQHDPGNILDVVEYVSTQATADKNGRIQNPAGLLIYYLRDDVPIPANFVTSRKRRISEAAVRRDVEQRQHLVDLELEFDTWRAQAVDDELAVRYPSPELERKVAEVVEQRSKSDKYFMRINAAQRLVLARQVLAKEVREQMALPSFEDWCKTHAQRNLFGK